MAGEPSIIKTAADKYFYADAKVVTAELTSCLPWFKELDKNEIKRVLQGVKERLLDIIVKKSLNGELHMKNY